MTSVPDHFDLPAELVGADRWVLWRYVKRGNDSRKIPFQARNPETKAKSNDPSTWVSFDEAIGALPFSGCDGLGFNLGEGFGGVDLDACRDPETGRLADWAQEHIDRLGSYTEVSPSGTGVKVITFGAGTPEELPRSDIPMPGEPIGGKRPQIQCFVRGRYFCVTGQAVDGCPRTLSDGSEGWSSLVERLTELASDNGSQAPRSSRADWPEIILRADAAPPATKLEALIENIVSARLTWDNRRPDLADQSPSGYDLAMANLAAAAGWTAQDIADLLVARRRRHGHDLKLRNVQKYRRTIAAAIAAQRSSPADTTGLEADTDARPVTLKSFYAYLPMHSYLYRPTRKLWPASSVNASLPPVPIKKPDGTPKLNKKGEPAHLPASAWLDENRSVQEMTWAPGEPEIIKDRFIVEGGWIRHPGARMFNLYQPPRIQPGEPDKATRWRELLRRVYPDDHEHITMWLAHRIQQPQEKVNHALVLGGPQGIGKDTLLEAAKHGVGPWNFHEISPPKLMGRFNGFVKAVVLRVSEARDLGEVNRFGFYEHMKVYTASPPDVLLVDEKNVREYVVPNLCGVVITTNNKDGLYLPPDDRRHYVAWSPLTKEDFTPEFWRQFWTWYLNGGVWHVVAYLADYNLAGFDPKAPPPKTPAFWQFVDANRAPEDNDLADALDDLGNPEAVTLGQIGEAASTEAFRLWLGDRRNAWTAKRRMEAVGYVSVPNPDTKDKVWKIAGRRQAVYARQELPPRDQIAAAQRLAEKLRGTWGT